MADGSVTIEVTLTKDQLEKALNNLKSTIDKSLPSASKALSTFASGFEGLGKVFTKAGKLCVGATAGIVAGLGSAIGRFDTLKNYPKVLENLGFSAEDAKKSINTLSDGIDGLPTSLDDAASGVQRLVAKNSDIDKSTKYFLAMNDAIVAGNAPAELQKTAIEQLTQAYSKGKPDMMEWRTLMTAMPGQLKQVATAMGYVDTDGLYEALKKGEISMDDFMDKIVELDENGAPGIKSFQEQAQSACDSIGTAITNLGNRTKKGFATILESMNEALKDSSFKGIAGMINALSSSIGKFLTKIGDAVKQNQAFKSLIGQISSRLSALQSTIDSLSPKTLDKIVTAIVNMVKYGPGLLIAGKAFSGISTALNGLSAGVKVIENMSGAVSKLPKAFSSLGGKVSSTISVIKTGFDSAVLKTATFAKLAKFNLVEGFSQAFPKITGIFNNIGSAISNFGSKIASGFSGLVGKVGTIFSGIGGKITGAFSGVASKIGSFLSPVTNILSNIGSKISTVFSGVLPNITTLFESIFGSISSKVSSFMSTIGPKLMQFLPMFTKAFNITAVIGLVVAGLGLLQSHFGEQINQIANTMITQGPTIIQNLVNGIVSALPNLIAQGSQLIQTFLQVLITNLPFIIQGGMQIIAGLVTGIAQQLPTLIPMVIQLIMTIVQSLIENLPLIIDAGIQLLTSLVEGIVNAIPQLINMLPQIIDTTVRVLTENLPKIIEARSRFVNCTN